MKYYRLVSAGLLLVALSSCGAFLAPSKGRWNPLDPTKDAGASLSVTDDGWVDYGSGYDFYGSLLYVSDSHRSLLRFPFSQVGSDLAHAELELYLEPGATFAVETGVRAIISVWNIGPAPWAFMIGGSTSMIGSPGIQVFQPGLYHFDVTSLFSNLGASAIQGLVVENRMPVPTPLPFRASEFGGSYPPKLLLWYQKW